MARVSESLTQVAQQWLAADPDPETRRELSQLLDDGDEAALAQRFAHPLPFGTAGLRGELGAGPAMINRVVVRRTTAGLAGWLNGRRDAVRGLVVGRDARHGSDAFAADVADVAAAFGVPVRAFSRPLPTPITAFAVKATGAAAGVMITASHNPPQYNGYKLYLDDGAQVIPPFDAEVAAAAEAAPLDPLAAAGDGAAAAGGEAMAAGDGAAAAGDGAMAAAVTHPFGDEDEQLLATYRAIALDLIDPDGPRALRIAYTPLHGVGGAVTPDLLVAAGFEAPALVTEQMAPDGDFPTVAFPNPEEPGTLDLALATARRVDADLMIANDPDADRLAVAVPERAGRGHDGGWRVLSGNELGILIGDHMLATSSGADRLVATTLVSSRMLAAQAAEAGVAYEETPTGFKWIARAATRRPGHRLLFGYEEALGYAVCDAVADKDGMTAALVVADMAAHARAAGHSLLERLDALYARLGVHLTNAWSIPGDIERLTELVDAWRGDPPTALAGHRVSEVTDLERGLPGYPPTTGLVLGLGPEARLVLRPSGTEPKLKLYLEAITPPPGADGLAAARERAQTTLREVRAEVEAMLAAGQRDSGR